MSIDRGPQGHSLGVDFGTSNTVAVARWPDGRARPILIDGSPLLPSAVYAEPDGTVSVGRDAVHSARLDPARFEPNPKRRIDDGTVLLGDREFPVVDLIAAVLARVAEEWHRAVGPVRPDTTLTCPASWGSTRRTLLIEAAARAGLEGARLVAEPVAAATYFAEVLGRDVPIGSVVVVHDFGAGTFDASVVKRTGEGFEVLAVDGRDDVGGLDIDAAVVEHLRTDQWRRLMEPATVEERRARRQLWDDVRIAKERLSRAQSADFVVPLLDVEAHLTRDELERVARPVLDETVRVTSALLNWADLADGRLAGVFLVGGASRIPLVATLLHRALGEAPVVIEQPELAVAEGSILAEAAMLATDAAAPGPTAEMRLISKGRAPSNPADGGRIELPLPPEPAAQTAPVWGSGDTRPSAVSRASSGASSHASSRASNAETQVARAANAETQVARAANAETQVARAADGHAPGTTGLQPPVDPWPDADHGEPWMPDPEATMPTPPPPASFGQSFGLPPKATGSGPANGSARRAAPTSPASPGPRPVGPGAGLTPASRRNPVPKKPVPNKPGRATGRPQAKVRRRRPRRFVRFLQILMSIVVMIAVPLAALVLAYGYGDGDSMRADVRQLLHDVADLLGIDNRFG